MSQQLRPVLYLAEPPAHYLARPPIVVDCSALAGLLFQETWRDTAAEKIHGRSLHAPFLLQTEIASVALKKHRKGFAELTAEALSQYAEMDLNLYRVEPQQALALALRYNLSAYDAAYLWLAAELKAPLATFDEKLATAAQTHLASLP